MPDRTEQLLPRLRTLRDEFVDSLPTREGGVSDEAVDIFFRRVYDVCVAAASAAEAERMRGYVEFLRRSRSMWSAREAANYLEAQEKKRLEGKDAQ